jgi:hypothetical protein
MKNDPSTVALDSPKGQDRAGRIRTRIHYLKQPNVRGWETKAEASALRWALARLEHLETRKPTISQAQAVAIIEAWIEAGSTKAAMPVVSHAGDTGVYVDGRPVLNGLDLEGLGIR